ncbi:hypothetical protein NDU88_011752 [Pleurodeles waltl]|uniref:Uncharacterized protein n=1 Tax=Pleurodeles waltl TaxID=8319 RepID=A0AAV7R2A1_PLEWA|nr:hypothetical protein NDU88_011752 [Pleurodeles waltl]
MEAPHTNRGSTCSIAVIIVGHHCGTSLWETIIVRLELEDCHFQPETLWHWARDCVVAPAAVVGAAAEHHRRRKKRTKNKDRPEHLWLTRTTDARMQKDMERDLQHGGELDSVVVQLEGNDLVDLGRKDLFAALITGLTAISHLLRPADIS